MDAVAYQMSFDKEQLALLCANYDRRIDSLCVENERLRQDNDRLIQAIEDLHDVRLEDRLVQLENSNDRLRELVLYAYECAIHSDHATCDDCRRMNSSCILADRMRELGIEAD